MQTPEGAIKARQTMIEKYGKDFYAKIGAEGGKKGKTGGWYKNPELARKWGSVGGKISKRRPNEN